MRIEGLKKKSFLPATAVLELTYRCNHACRFCCCPWYSGIMTPGEEMAVEEWKAFFSREEMYWDRASQISVKSKIKEVQRLLGLPEKEYPLASDYDF